MPHPNAILIAGPTASGKSALALGLAQAIGGTIVNADSMQVYRDLRIITARPAPGEEAQVPHRLYGHVDAAENYSVGRWLTDVGPVLQEVGASGRAPVLVGGTGLYFKALTQGLSAVPPIPQDIRVHDRAVCCGTTVGTKGRDQDPTTRVCQRIVFNNSFQCIAEDDGIPKGICDGVMRDGHIQLILRNNDYGCCVG